MWAFLVHRYAASASTLTQLCADDWPCNSNTMDKLQYSKRFGVDSSQLLERSCGTGALIMQPTTAFTSSITGSAGFRIPQA
jgi:hypothetical protein